MNIRIRSASIGLLTLFLTPSLALAAEAAHGEEKPSVMGFDLLQFGMAIAVFLIAFFVLQSMVWPKILGGLDARQQKIRGEVFAAEELRKTAAKEKAEFQKALADAKAESARMIEQTRAEQARLAADLRMKAEAELNAMRDEARANIEAAKRSAIAEIHREGVRHGAMIAEQILRREVKPDDHRRLAEESLGQFQREYSAN